MNRTILISILLILSSFTLRGQVISSNNNVVLPRLSLKQHSIQTILGDIDTFIANKPNGLHFPITKIVFSQLEDLTCFEIVGIDNSWTDLFKFGEVPYGYVIVHNRLYMVVVEGYHNVDLTSVFDLTDMEKSFSKGGRPAGSINRNPIWFFEYRNEQSYLISVSDLDVLN